jgi:hypothetical protein
VLESVLAEYMGGDMYREDLKEGKVDNMWMVEIYIFVTTLIVVLGLFAVFHWYLVLWGKTTIEYCFTDNRYTPSESWLDNIEIVFGTRNLFLIFFPKLSVLKMKGYEW